MCVPRAAERGQTLPVFAVTFVAVLGFAGLALDGARLYAEHERIQRAADAAAIGAAHELGRGHSGYAESLLPAAIHDAGLHGVTLQDAEIIVQHPPVSGAYAGSPAHVEVVVRAELPTTFMAMFGKHSQPVSGRAVAGVVAEQQPCLTATAPAGAGALTVEGTQALEIDCAVSVASRDASAWISADACVDAARGVAVAGGVSGSCLNGDVWTGADGLRGPAATPRMPSCAGRPPGVADAADDGMVLYWPGCYEGPVEIGGGRAQLMPGEHIFLQGLRVTGGVVAGRDVVLFFPASAEQRGITVGAAAAVELNAPARGEHAGLLMFAEAGGAAGEAVLERSAASRFSGSLLFPGRTVRWAPNPPGAKGWARVAADRIVILEGPGGRTVEAPPAETASSYRAVLAE